MCDLSGNVSFMRADSKPVDWANRIISISGYDRIDRSKDIAEKGYDVFSVQNRLLDILSI